MRYFKTSILLIFLIILILGCSTNHNDQDSTTSELTNEINNNEKNKENSTEETDSINEEHVDHFINDIDINDDASLAVLVNKERSLSENYEPEDLVPVEVPTVLENPEVNQLRKEAADALKNMFEHAAEEGIY